MMGLVLQETCCESQVLKPSIKAMKIGPRNKGKKSCSLNLDRYLNRNSIYQDLRTKLNRSSTKAKSVKIYEIRISKSNFRLMLIYLYKVSFFTILDIYEAYFKGYTWRTDAISDLVPYSLCKKLPRLLRFRVL